MSQNSADAVTASATPPVQRDIAFRQLEVFHAVMTAGSVSGAARMLGISQPSLSRSLRRLEDQLRLSLFMRHRQRLVPSREAERLFETLAPALEQMHNVAATARQIAEGQTRMLRFAASQSMARVLVPRAIAELRQSVPDLDVCLDGITRAQQVDYLLAGEGQGLISLAGIDHPLIRRRELGQTPLVALVHKSHRLAQLPRLQASDIATDCVIRFGSDGPHAMAILSFLGEMPRRPGQLTVRFADAAINLVRERQGIALIDGFTTLAGIPPEVICLPLVSPPLFTASLYSSNARIPSRHITRISEIISTSISAIPTF